MLVAALLCGSAGRLLHETRCQTTRRRKQATHECEAMVMNEGEGKRGRDEVVSMGHPLRRDMSTMC